MFFDGTDVSHAGLFLGKDSAGKPKVGEAIGAGLISQDLDLSIQGKEVHARRLKTYPGTMDPVLAVATDYIANKNRYAHEQILLLAVICLIRKVPVTPGLHLLLRRVIDSATSFLLGLASNKEPMICSEFVYRCYDEALPAYLDPYSLRIDGISPDTPTAAGAMIRLPMGEERRVRAQGVHPESLLALFAAAPMSALSKPGISEADFSVAPQVVSQTDLEGAIQTYLDEVKRQPLSGFEAAELESLKGATTKFAGAYYTSLLKVASPDSTALAYGSSAPFFQRFFKVSADFVTPGDLFKCTSLYKVGCL